MNDIIKQYKEVIIKALFFIVVLVALGLVSLYPVHTEHLKLEQKIAETSEEIERQSVYRPQYEEFKAMSSVGEEVHFPTPEPAYFKIQDIGVLPFLVSTLAEKSGLKVVDVVISPSSLRKNGGQLMLQAMTTGDKAAFDTFYKELFALGTTSRVSMFEVKASQGGLSFFLEFWVNIEEKMTDEGQPS